MEVTNGCRGWEGGRKSRALDCAPEAVYLAVFINGDQAEAKTQRRQKADGPCTLANHPPPSGFPCSVIAPSCTVFQTMDFTAFIYGTSKDYQKRTFKTPLGELEQEYMSI